MSIDSCKTRTLLVTLIIYLLGTTVSNAQWITRARMPTPRQEVPHAVLDGKIYVPGGLTQTSASSVVEIYDPATNQWETIAPMPQPLHHVGLAPADGKMYVLGGYLGFTFNATNLVFEYDPQENDWEIKSPLPTARGAAVAVQVDGVIYVIGGVANGAPTSLNEVYNPATDMWATRTPMPTAREHLAAARIGTRIYVVGGRRCFGGCVNDNVLQIYDTENDTWETGASMPTARGGLAAAAHGGKIYVFGGEIPGVFSENEVYDPAGDQWSSATPLPTARHGMGAATIGDTIFVIGGGTIAGLMTTAVNEGFVLDPATSIADERPVPKEFALFQNYPNPFNPATTIRFALADRARAAIKIYNLLGKEIAVLADETLPQGEHSVRWQPQDANSGVFFYALFVDGARRDLRRMILLR